MKNWGIVFLWTPEPPLVLSLAQSGFSHVKNLKVLTYICDFRELYDPYTRHHIMYTYVVVNESWFHSLHWFKENKEYRGFQNFLAYETKEGDEKQSPQYVGHFLRRVVVEVHADVPKNFNFSNGRPRKWNLKIRWKTVIFYARVPFHYHQAKTRLHFHFIFVRHSDVGNIVGRCLPMYVYVRTYVRVSQNSRPHTNIRRPNSFSAV